MATPKPEADPKTGVYKVSFYTTEGRRVRRSLRTRDYEVAKRKAEQLYRQECKADLTPRPQQTFFHEAVTAYVKAGGEPRFLKPILMELGPTATVEDLDDMAIANLAAKLHENPATQQRQVWTPVRAVINFSQGKRRRPRADNPRTRWLTPEETEALLWACESDIQTRAKIAFLLGTGCRTGEMFALDMDQFFPETGEALFLDTKNGRERMVKLLPRALDMVLPAITWPAGAVFRTPKGLPYKMREKGGGQMQTAFNKARDAAGLGSDVTPHVLRHTWATWHYAVHKDILKLMTDGNWLRQDMVQRYVKIAPADLPARLLAHGWVFDGQGRTSREQTRDKFDQILPVNAERS